MKSYEEMAQNVFRRGNECIQKRQKRITAVKKASAAVCTFCAVIAFLGIIGIDSQKPDVSDDSRLNINFSDEELYSSNGTTITIITAATTTTTTISDAITTTSMTASSTDLSALTAFTEQPSYPENIMVNDETIPVTNSSHKATTTKTSALTTTAAASSTVNTTSDPAYSGSCGGNANYEYDESTRTLHIMGSASYSDPIDLDSLSHLYDKVNVLVLDKGIEALGYRSDANHLVVKIMQYAEDLTIYHYNGLRDQAWIKLYCNNYFEDSVKFINVELDSVSGVSCGDDLWFDYDMDTRSLYFHGTGDTMDETKLEYLVGYFDKVYIDKSIVSLNHISANHIFVANTFTVSPTKIYHYSEYTDVSGLKKAAGDCIEFINLDEEPLS